jgi:hypothetical protein
LLAEPLTAAVVIPKIKDRIPGDFIINPSVLKTRCREEFIPAEFFAQGG